MGGLTGANGKDKQSKNLKDNCKTKTLQVRNAAIGRMLQTKISNINEKQKRKTQIAKKIKTATNEK